jgi:hypothetical protein
LEVFHQSFQKGNVQLVGPGGLGEQHRGKLVRIAGQDNHVRLGGDRDRNEGFRFCQMAGFVNNDVGEVVFTETEELILFPYDFVLRINDTIKC